MMGSFREYHNVNIQQLDQFVYAETKKTAAYAKA